MHEIERQHRLGINSATPTDLPQKWSEVKGRQVEPASYNSLALYRNPTASKQPPVQIEVPESDIKEFMAACFLTEPKTLACTLFAEYNNQFVNKEPVQECLKLPQCLWKDLYKPQLTVPLEKHCQSVFNQLKNSVTQTEIDYLERVTRSQALNTTWIEHRAGRITASNAHPFMVDKLDVAPSTIKAITIPVYNQVKNPYLEHGRKFERTVLEDFSAALNCLPTTSQKILQSPFQDLHEHSLNSAGLYISLVRPYLGASPDSVMLCECCGITLVEAKTKPKYNHTGIEEAVKENPKDICVFVDKDTGEYDLKRDHQYYTQVQMQMHVTQIPVCHLVLWTSVDMVIVRVEQDLEFEDLMLENCDRKYLRCILPELVTRQQQNASAISQSAQAYSQFSDHFTCCANQTRDLRAITCMVCKKAYHLECVNRTKASSTWKCFICKPKKSVSQD